MCGAQRLRMNSKSILKIQTSTHAEHAISQDVVHRPDTEIQRHSLRCAYLHLHSARITSRQMFKYLSAVHEHINFYSALRVRNCQQDNSLIYIDLHFLRPPGSFPFSGRCSHVIRSWFPSPTDFLAPC